MQSHDLAEPDSLEGNPEAKSLLQDGDSSASAVHARSSGRVRALLVATAIATLLFSCGFVANTDLGVSLSDLVGMSKTKCDPFAEVSMLDFCTAQPYNCCKKRQELYAKFRVDMSLTGEMVGTHYMVPTQVGNSKQSWYWLCGEGTDGVANSVIGGIAAVGNVMNVGPIPGVSSSVSAAMLAVAQLKKTRSICFKGARIDVYSK